MKKLLQFFLVALWMSSFTHSYGQSGSISGLIVDENKLGMPGASVYIPSLDRGTITNEKGQFDILNVPENTYSLEITFIGYQKATSQVRVENGNTSSLNVSLEPGILLKDEVLVLGDRLKGQAKALNEQMNRGNISNIVAADQIGRFPDANIGDALKRIPGITMQYDQGEARDIIIRGMAPQLNSVTLNGERIPSAEGDNRRIQMDLIPSDMIQLIEVNKAVTPDMDADAIGGSVNLVTRTTVNSLRVSGTLASGYNFLTDKPIWTGGLIVGNRFANNKLGAVLSLSYNKHDFGSENIELEWVDTDDYGPIPNEFQARNYLVTRIRRSASLGLDYQFDANNAIYLSGMYNWRDDWENRFRYVVGDLEDAYDDGNFTPTGSNMYETLGTYEREDKAGKESDRIKSRRLEDQRNSNISLRGEHLIANKLKLWWSGTYANASETRPHERYLNYALDEVPVIVDLRDLRKPNVYAVQENAWQDLEFDELTDEYQITWEEDYNGKIDLQLPVSNLGIIKFGGLYRNKIKKRNNNFFEYTPTGGQSDGAAHPDFGGSWDSAEEEFADLTMDQVPVINKTSESFLPGSQYKTGYFVDNKFIGGLDLTNPDLYEAEDKPDEYAPANFKADEKIAAGYAMADFQWTDHFSTLVGVRIENTNINYNGFSFDDEEETIGTTEGSNSYTNVLPGVHLKYDFGKNYVFRLAWTNTLARPDYYRLVPFEEYNPEDGELIAGNPELDPTTSMNFDLMAEKYFTDIGLVSIGGFYKDVKDFIYEQEMNNFLHPVYGEVDFTTFNNGQSATVMGFEAAIQKQLDFLPGLGIYLNYTFTESSADGIEGREEEELGLPGTAKHMFNASLSYETSRLVLRVSLNHSSDYIDELGGESFEDRYYDKQTFVDFNGSYAFSRNWRFFVEVNNITNQPLRFYQGRPELTMQEEYYNTRMNLGLKFDLFGN